MCKLSNEFSLLVLTDNRLDQLYSALLTLETLALKANLLQLGDLLICSDLRYWLE